MTPPLPHPPEFVRLCERAIEALRAFPASPQEERGERLAALHAQLAEIGERMAELDLRSADFPEEQATLGDAASALLALEVDRGGPHAPRYVKRIIGDLRRISGL